MTRNGMLVGMLLAATPVFAAKMPNPPQPELKTHLPDHVPVARTIEALSLPTANALKVLSTQGTGGYRNLVALAFAADQSIDVQWKSLVMLSILGGPHSLPQLEKAASSDQWYHRNAALLGLSKVSRDKAIQWARHLLADPSLIVRTSAVQTLKAFKDSDSAKSLWTELYHERNFKSGQSLWIRRHIVEALAEMARPGDEAKLVGILQDADGTLYKAAIRGLERATQKTFGQPEEPVAFKRKYWQKWWEARQGTPASTTL